DLYMELNDPNCYVSNTLERTFPRGLDYEVFSFSLLDEAYRNATLEYDKEHVTPYIHQNRSGNVKLVNLRNTEDRGQYRITLDTIEDFTLLNSLIKDHNADQMGYVEIEQLLETCPELVEINAHVEQKKA